MKLVRLLIAFSPLLLLVALSLVFVALIYIVQALPWTRADQWLEDAVDWAFECMEALVCWVEDRAPEGR